MHTRARTCWTHNSLARHSEFYNWVAHDAKHVLHSCMFIEGKCASIWISSNQSFMTERPCDLRALASTTRAFSVRASVAVAIFDFSIIDDTQPRNWMFVWIDYHIPVIGQQCQRRNFTRSNTKAIRLQVCGRFAATTVCWFLTPHHFHMWYGLYTTRRNVAAHVV